MGSEMCIRDSFSTALPPTVSASENEMLFRGFDAATEYRYSGINSDQAEAARAAAASAIGVAAIVNARRAAQRGL